MITEIDLNLPQIIGLKLKGYLNKMEVKSTIERIMKARRLPPQFHFFVDIESNSGFDYSNFLEAINYCQTQPSVYKRRVRKVAYLTSDKYLSMAVTEEFLQIPRIKLKAFRRNQRETALKWLTL